MFSGFETERGSRHGLVSAGLCFCSDLAKVSKWIKTTSQKKQTYHKFIIYKMRLFFYINYTQDTMQKYILHHLFFWWSIIVWFPCQVWWTGFHYHSTCFNSWWNARCSCAWDYIEFTTLFVKSESLFSCFCECVVWGKIVDLLSVCFTFWIHDMYWYVWLIISWKGKVTTFPCTLSVYWGVYHQKNTHIFHGSTMDMYGYLDI